MKIEELKEQFKIRTVEDWLCLEKDNGNVRHFIDTYANYEKHLLALETLNTYEEVSFYVEQTSNEYRKKRKQINGQKTRFRKRLRKMSHPYFITITFTDEALQKDFKRILREYFKKVNMSFCLVSDYGEQNNRFHYHGIINIPDASVLEKKINGKNGKVLRGFALNVVYNIPYLTEHIGYNALTKLKNTSKNTNKILGYTFKYIYKNDKREIFASRGF